MLLMKKFKPKVKNWTNSIKENQNGISWYLSFKEPPEICENSSNDDNCE